MIVCIAEKPSVARDIARILGATTRHDGYMEGNGYQVTWTFGHLCTLKEPDDYTPMWKRWSLGALPMIPPRFGIKLIDDDGIKKQFGIIEKLYSKADSIVNCGDAGQEGELIQRWVMQKAGVRCPVQRLWISSMTDDAIRAGFNALSDESRYDRLYLAGLCRAIGDWLLGMNATRLYTLKYGLGHQVLSVGRVQTPTLALIVDRDKQIAAFKPEPYWVLATVYRGVTFTATSGRFSSREEGEKAFADIADKPLIITGVTRKKGREQPPMLYDLTSLQVESNNKYGYTAEMTLNTVQSLYEKKLTTYPRVDTQYLPEDVYDQCPKIMNGLFQSRIQSQQVFEEPIRRLSAMGKLKKTKRIFDNSKITDHHAIIPTGVPAKSLTNIEQNIYELIARRFISAFYPDCLFSQTTVTGTAGDTAFKATGKEITDEGWRHVYGKDKTDDGRDKDGNGVMPAFTKGESGPHKPTLTEKQTTAPKHYTEATLLRAMETAGKFVDDEELRQALKENGIGRPSSRAGIIETLFKRHYIRRERKNLIATSTGISLIDTIHEELLKSCELTGIWEKKLRDIEHGSYEPAEFIDGLKKQIQEIVIDVLSDNSLRRISAEEEEPDKPKKKKSTRARKKTTKKDDSKTATDNNTTAPAATAGDDITGKPCPVCGKGVIIKGHSAYGCSRWREGCTFRKPF